MAYSAMNYLASGPGQPSRKKKGGSTPFNPMEEIPIGPGPQTITSVWTPPKETINIDPAKSTYSSTIINPEKPVIPGPTAPASIFSTQLANQERPVIGIDQPKTITSSTPAFDKSIKQGDVDPGKFQFNTPTSGLYKSALEIMGQGLTGEGTKATQAAILGGREALATARKGAEAQAGGLASATGAIGQGTAGSSAQQIRQESLQAMAQQEIGFAQLKSNEQQAMVDKIVAAEHAEKGLEIQSERTQLEERGQNITIEQLNRQFDQWDAEFREKVATRMQQGEQFNLTRLDQIDQFGKTLDLTKKQWDDKFGLEKSKVYTDALLELSMDNPVLASKVTSYLLTGGTGAIGAFTEAEQKELIKLADDARAKDAQLAEIWDLTIANLKKELQGFSGYTGNNNNNDNNNSLNLKFEDLTDEQFATNIKNPDWFAYQTQQGNIPALDQAGAVTPEFISSLFAEDGSRGMVSLNGQPFTIHKFDGDGVTEITSSPDLEAGTKVSSVSFSGGTGTEGWLVLDGAHSGEIYNPWNGKFYKLSEVNAEMWKKENEIPS